MTVQHFASLWRSETNKLLSRTSARLGLVVAGLIGVGAPLLVLGVTLLFFRLLQANAVGPAELPPIPVDSGLIWALRMRNFLILPAFLIMIVSLSFAGEYQARTLREDLLRPIPRWSLLAAKWSAMATWVSATVALTWLPAAFLGLILFRGDGDTAGVTLGYLATGLSDVALGTLVLAIAVLTRSVPGTIVGVLLFYVLAYAAMIGMYLSRIMPFVPKVVVDVIDMALPWTPASAFSVWRGFEASGAWSWQGFAGLAIIAGLSSVAALWRFERLDVP